MSSRRTFMISLPAVGMAWGFSRRAFAAAPMVDEKEPTALGVGYVTDAARADKAKYKNFAAGQQCSGCALFQGKAGDAAGGCALFPSKQVTGKGWCSAFAKKA